MTIIIDEAPFETRRRYGTVTSQLSESARDMSALRTSLTAARTVVSDTSSTVQDYALHANEKMLNGNNTLSH